MEHTFEIPDEPVRPGLILKKLLREKGWTEKELALVIGKPVGYVRDISNGTQRVSAELSVDLGVALGAPWDYFAVLETRFRISNLAQSDRLGNIERVSRLFSWVPVAELVRRGWIRKAASTKALESRVLEFFGISDFEEEIPSIARPSNIAALTSYERGALTAWLRRLTWESERKSVVGQFEPHRLYESIPEIMGLMQTRIDFRDIAEKLSAYGIRAIALETLPKLYLEGATGKGPVLGVTLRKRKVGEFGCLLQHMLGHLILKHEGHIEMTPFCSREKEHDEAEAFATSHFSPTDNAVSMFLHATDDTPTKDEILNFSDEHGIHPGITIERILRRGVELSTRYQAKIGLKQAPPGKSTIAELNRTILRSGK